ncbi:endonuclease domain of the non-LTR retrotransposon LINE-1 [Elysia marginata]|uniref:Endonuclease domain of the non-LTR retrotransposon LINE-1 n=1 Tax=Elysia marginata TaxID=1093978 RepID=A0AAV4FHD1_9GAST|nr:endonuclease domain of the non-LTR retrotransposon LINE-1 [Elysia marginata]
MIYTPQGANKQHASKQIADITYDLLDKSPGSVVLITGDFNQHNLPTFHPYIDYPTRGNARLGLSYGYIAEAYRFRPLRQLGKSDHTMIHLMLKCWPLLKREKPQKKEVNVWSKDSV